MPKRLFVLDYDGVATDKKAVTNPQAIELAAQIALKDPFAFITGRSLEWLGANAKRGLEKVWVDANHWPTFFMLGGEYGAHRLIAANKPWQPEEDTLLSLSNLRGPIREEIKGLRGVFFDGTKRVMISVEAEHKLRDTQNGMVEADLMIAGKILQGYAARSDGKLEYHRTTYACDLTPAGLSKESGMGQVLTALKQRPDHVYMVGDAPSDLGLTKPLKMRGIPFTFYFVGDRSQLQQGDTVKHNLQFPEKMYDEGTVQVLSQFV